VGFGQGYFLEAAVEAGLRPIGLDRHEPLVLNARARGFEAICGDVRDLPQLLDVPLDGVMASHIIEHLPPNEVAQLLTDLAAWVRPGGIAVLCTPNMRDWRVASEWFWLDPTHVRPYPPGAVQQLINDREWRWDGNGRESMTFTRHSPMHMLNRIRFGSDYGWPGLWYRLRRV
jgi:O-antigen chain-terminating methyltransferase